MSHFRNNVKEHLKVLDGSNKNKITNQIFVYHTVDGIYTDEGMVDAYGQPLPPKIQTIQTVSNKQKWFKRRLLLGTGYIWK